MANILLVDDEECIRFTLTELLSYAGHNVTVAEDAETASALIEKQAFDVVVLDIILPRASGIELLETVRQSSPHTQVVMMTGEPTVDTASGAVRLGAFDYLCKPVSKNDLLKTVSNAIKAKELEDERSRLEQERDRYEGELERLVDERTAALRQANAELQEAVAELQRNRQEAIHRERLGALGTMASGIAHDLNNALAPVLGFSELLLMQDELLDDRARTRELLTTINSCAEDGSHIISRLKEFYRFRDPDDPVQAVDPNAVVEKAVALTSARWRDQALADGRTLSVLVDARAGQLVAGSESELREMMTNLILNAADAITGKNGEIAVRACSSKDQVFLEVSDTGCGMTEEVRRKCLEPFFTTKGEAGTGMGLAMVFGTVNRHGGDIEIESQPGKGTTFRIRLPAGTPETAKPATRGVPTVSRASMRLLVVDDEPSISEMLEKLLTAAGHKVTTASNGAEALRLFEPGTFDAVLTDCAMPEVNGKELAAMVKRRAPGQPVIMVTGFGTTMKAMDEKPEGVDILIGKPITQKALTDALARAAELGREAVHL